MPNQKITREEFNKLNNEMGNKYTLRDRSDLFKSCFDVINKNGQQCGMFKLVDGELEETNYSTGAHQFIVSLRSHKESKTIQPQPSLMATLFKGMQSQSPALFGSSQPFAPAAKRSTYDIAVSMINSTAAPSEYSDTDLHDLPWEYKVDSVEDAIKMVFTHEKHRLPDIIQHAKHKDPGVTEDAIKALKNKNPGFASCLVEQTTSCFHL